MKIREILGGKKYFVTGIDTDAGKTVATGYLSRLLLDEGVDVITMKLVQTGCTGISEDIEVHRRIEGRPLLDEDRDHTTNPQLFAKPASPHLAAELDGKGFDGELVRQAFDKLCATHEVVLVEGAGGLMVPLTIDLLTLDYIAPWGCEAIVVTTAALGSINHLLLTLSELTHRGIPVAAVVYNEAIATDDEITADTRRYVEHYLHTHYPTTHLITLPRLNNINTPVTIA